MLQSAEPKDWTESITEIVYDEEHLAWLRRAVREIEKFAMLSTYSADANSKHLRKAQDMLRLSVGLRRMLDSWRIKDGE